MNPLLYHALPWAVAALACALLFLGVQALVGVIDSTRATRERSQHADRDFWRTVNADPRRSRHSNRGA